ncbi:MAG TPA: N-formylglutamate amidohydrolase [Aliiroseovarius sp.]|nr:N-formylglutamate amidohydrolase [Aliiroseovarius sp.]
MQQVHSDKVVETEGLSGRAPALVLCEHASHNFPPRFGTLGLSEEVQLSHAAWDPGALDLARSLAAYLGAPLVASRVSRLLYDCNRPPEAPGAMTERSERFEIPGNKGLTEQARLVRTEQIYVPFCNAVSHALEVAKPKALITMHTFTPVYNGARRPVEIGVLHDTDSRLADAMLDNTGENPPYRVERNDPYGPEDGVTHSLKLHALPRGLLNVMIEVRNDLVADKQGLAEVSSWLNPLIARGLEVCCVEMEGQVR